jgi:hypothetical protein
MGVRPVGAQGLVPARTCLSAPHVPEDRRGVEMRPHTTPDMRLANQLF